MVLRMKFFLLALATLVALSGCYSTPVRHLTSDVALLKVGESTAEDVLIFMGAPDERQELGSGVEKWVYKDKEMSFLEKAPLIGKHLGSPEYKQVVVTITKNIVSEAVYTSSDADDLDWANDYSWQEKKK